MATLLFNALASAVEHNFSHRAFITLNQEDSTTQLRQHLSQLLEDLGMSGQKQHSLRQLQSHLHDCVRGKTVLLVVDNVWTAEQLDALVPPAECFTPGSRLVVTSRFQSLAKDGSQRYLVSSTMVVVGCSGTGNTLVQASCRARIGAMAGDAVR